MNTIAEETFSNIRTVKAFNTEEREIGRFKEKNKQVLRLGMKKAMIVGFSGFSITCVFWASFGAIVYNAYNLYLDGKLGVGSIFAYMEYMITLLMNFGMLIGLIVQTSFMFGAADRVM